MAGKFMTITATGAPEINRDLKKGADMMGRPLTLFHYSTELYFSDVEQVFKTEGVHGSGAWAALSEGRKKARERDKGKRWREHPILQFHGDLYNAATTRRGYSGPKVSRTTRYGKDYATFEISGYKVLNQLPDRPNLPAREFWPWDRRRIDLLYEPFQKWFEAWADGTVYRLPGRKSR